MKSTLRILCWSGMAPELRDDAEGWQRYEATYPDGVGPMLAAWLDTYAEFAATGLHETVPAADALDDCDVLVAWGHGCENWCWDEKVDISGRVRSGRLGLVAMHSIWNATVWPHITDLLGARADLGDVREDVPIEVRRTEVVHAVTEGVDDFELTDEIYFPPLVTAPDVKVLLTGHWQGIESPYAWTREVEAGRVVYLQPGHETLPTYAHASMQRLLLNAVRWVRP